VNWQPPAFDKHQFAGRRSRAISARYTPEGWDSTGISFSDYDKMHINHRERVQERRLDTPSWAVNDTELREVLLKFCERRFYIDKRHRAHVPNLTQEQRYSRIRQIERLHVKRWERIYQEHRETYKALPEERKAKFEIQLRNADMQVHLYRRGAMAMAAAIVYLYYRLGHDSVTVAETLRINSPLVRQFLARLHNAATDTYYVPPKWRCIKELRRQLSGIRLLFKRVGEVTKQYNKEQSRAKREQLALLQKQVRDAEKIFNRIPHATVTKPRVPCQKVRWTKDRLLFIHFCLLSGQPWEQIAPKVGYKGTATLRQAYRYFMEHPQKLAEYTGSISEITKRANARPEVQTARSLGVQRSWAQRRMESKDHWTCKPRAPKSIEHRERLAVSMKASWERRKSAAVA
jgi:hypothetical protein